MVGDCIAGQRAYDDGYVQGRADAQDDRDVMNTLALCRGELAACRAEFAERNRLTAALTDKCRELELQLAECKAKLAAAEKAKEKT